MIEYDKVLTVGNWQVYNRDLTTGLTFQHPHHVRREALDLCAVGQSDVLTTASTNNLKDVTRTCQMKVQ